MSRPDCPRKNTFPNGCRFWDADGKTHTDGSCRFDVTEMRDGYGPFYVTTKCNRLGNANQPDNYQRTDDYAKAASAINWDSLAARTIGNPYEYERWAEARDGFFRAVIAEISKRIEGRK